MHSYMNSISSFSPRCNAQIIIEAISGQTRLSDIAFDDVSILTDQDCTNESSNENDDDSDDGNDAKDPEPREDEDGGGILNVESCVNRCFEDVNATVHLYANKTLSCICSNDCDVRSTCCPDYIGEFKRPHFHHFVVIIHLH